MKRTFCTGSLIILVFSILAFSGQPSPKASMERGKKVYDTYCIACHQADGSGVPRMNPPLVKTSYVTGDKKKLVTIVLNGLKGGELEIDGNVYDSPMTPHDFLKDQEIADVLTYIRNSFGNKASAVTAAEVKSIRASIKK
jgi:mono/diheme cytochrome c family protein